MIIFTKIFINHSTNYLDLPNKHPPVSLVLVITCLTTALAPLISFCFISSHLQEEVANQGFRVVVRVLVKTRGKERKFVYKCEKEKGTRRLAWWWSTTAVVAGGVCDNSGGR